MTSLAARPLSSAAAGILALVAFGLAVSMLPDTGWRLPLAAAKATLAAACVAAPFGALFFLGLLAPFDGYIPALALHGDLLLVDVIGLALIVGELRRGWRFPHTPGAATALIAVFALVVFNVVSVGAANWTSAWDNAARLGFWWAVTAAVISVRQHTPVTPICIGLVLGMTARFAFEAYWFVTSPGFVLHPSYQFGVFTSNPNTLAGLGACVLPIAAGLAVASGSRAMKLLWTVVAVALLLGIVVSFSKGSWLAAAAGAGVWVLHGLRTGFVNRRALLRVGAAAVLVVLVIPAARRVPGVMLERWTSHGSAVSNQERLRYVETAVSLILEHPLAGVGLERFGEEYSKARRLLRGPDDPHNAYLMVAVELGIPALAALLVFQGLVAMSAFISVREGPLSAAPLFAGLSAGVVVLLVFQMFSAEPLSARTALVVMALGLTLPGMADRETALT